MKISIATDHNGVVEKLELINYLNELNIFNDGELERESNVQKMHVPNSDKLVPFYNLDVINVALFRKPRFFYEICYVLFCVLKRPISKNLAVV